MCPAGVADTQAARAITAERVSNFILFDIMCRVESGMVIDITNKIKILRLFI